MSTIYYSLREMGKLAFIYLWNAPTEAWTLEYAYVFMMNYEDQQMQKAEPERCSRVYTIVFLCSVYFKHSQSINLYLYCTFHKVKCSKKFSFV